MGSSNIMGPSEAVDLELSPLIDAALAQTQKLVSCQVHHLTNRESDPMVPQFRLCPEIRVDTRSAWLAARLYQKVFFPVSVFDFVLNFAVLQASRSIFSLFKLIHRRGGSLFNHQRLQLVMKTDEDIEMVDGGDQVSFATNRDKKVAEFHRSHHPYGSHYPSDEVLQSIQSSSKQSTSLKGQLIPGENLRNPNLSPIGSEFSEDMEFALHSPPTRLATLTPPVSDSPRFTPQLQTPESTSHSSTTPRGKRNVSGCLNCRLRRKVVIHLYSRCELD